MFDYHHPCFLINNKHHFSIIGLDVRHFGYNSVYEFQLTIYSATQVKPQALLESSSFYLADINANQLPVDIDAVQHVAIEGEHYVKLTANSPLHRLKEVTSNRVFYQQPIKPLLQTLLAKHNIYNVVFQFNEEIIPFMVQHQQSDLHLFYEIIVNYSLRFYFNVERQQWIFLQEIKSPLNDDNLTTKTVDLIGRDRERTQVQTICCSLPTTIVLHSYQNLAFNKHSSITLSEEGSRSEKITLTINQVINDARRLSQLGQELLAQMDCYRDITIIDSCDGLAGVGDILTVYQGNRSDNYRVIALTGQWHDLSHNAAVEGYSTNHWRYYLIPYNKPYLPFNHLLYPKSFSTHLRHMLSPALESSKSWPHTLFAPIEKPPIPPLINATVSARKGIQSYDLCFPEHNHDKAEKVNSMTALGQQQEGGGRLLLPFSDNSNVVVAFLNNSYYLPIIIGQVSHSTAMNQLVTLKTPGSLALTVTNKQIQICQDSSHQLLLNDESSRHSGVVSAEKKRVVLYAKDSLTLTAHQTMRFNSKTITLSANNQIAIQTKTLHLNAKYRAVFNAHSHYTYADKLLIETQELESQGISCLLQTNQQLRISGQTMGINGELSIQAQRIRIKTATAYLQLDTTGLSFSPGLSISAPIISLSADCAWLNPH